MKRYLYLYNPFSGSQAGGHDLDLILGTCYKNDIHLIPHRLFTMEDDVALEQFLSDREQFDGVLISGGDGTVGQMIDRMIAYGNDTPVGIIPGGTCNDFARNLNMPSSALECVSALCKPCVEEVDLLRVKAGEQVRYICNSIAAGVFVGVSHSTSPEFKKVFGSLAYYISALGELADIHSFHIKAQTEDQTVETDALVFAVLNGMDVGGMRGLIQEADLQDGKMNLMIVRDCGPIERAGVGINLLAHKPDKNVIRLSCKRVRISVDKDLAVSVDGENGPGLPYEIEVVPRRLKVLLTGPLKQ